VRGAASAVLLEAGRLGWRTDGQTDTPGRPRGSAQGRSGLWALQERGFLCAADKYGLNVLFCMPNRTSRALLVSVMGAFTGRHCAEIAPYLIGDMLLLHAGTKPAGA
jgi:hypothetical protein